MSKISILLLALIGALVAFLVAAVVLVPRNTDWNTYKPEIINAFFEHTGMQLEINGDIRFVFLPRPHLTMERGVIKNNPPAAVTLSFKKTSENILEVARVDAYLDIVPLLTGKLDVHVRLVDPILNLERFDGNEFNISPFIQAVRKQNQGKNASIHVEPAREIGSFALKGVEIANGQIQFSDLVANTQEQWQITDGLAVLNLGYGTVKANGTVLFDNNRYDYSLAATPDERQDRFATRGMIGQLADTGAHSRILQFNGFFWFDGAPRVVVRTNARERFIPLSGGATQSAQPSSFWTQADIEATWGETPALRITNLALGFGEDEEDSAPVLEGSAELLWQRENGKLVLTSELQGGAWGAQEVQGLLAYAKWLGTGGTGKDSQAKQTATEVAQGATQEATGPPSQTTSGFLDGLDASMKFSLEALSYGGISARHIRADLRNQGENLLVDGLSLRLAGDTTFTTSGRFIPNRLGDTAGGDTARGNTAGGDTTSRTGGDKNAPEPFYIGSTSLESGDLVVLLDDLQNRSGTARQATTSPAKAQGDLLLFREAGGALSAQLRDLALSAAGSKATADLDWRGGILAADIRAQRLDLNRIRETFALHGGQSTGTSTRQQTGTEAAGFPALALLLRADQVLYDKHRFNDLVLRADRKIEQQWRIERLAMGYSGWQVSASGILARHRNAQRNFWALGDGQISAQVEADQLRRAAAVVGLSARRAEALRGVRVKSSVSGSLDNLVLGAKATFAYGLEVSANGTAALHGLSRGTTGGTTRDTTQDLQVNLRGQIRAPDIRPVSEVWLDGKEVPFLRGVLTSDLSLKGGTKGGAIEIVSARIGTFPFNGNFSWQEDTQAQTSTGTARAWQAVVRGGRLDMNRRAADSLDPEGGLAPAEAKIPLSRRLQNLSRRPFGFRFDEDLSLDLSLELDSLILGKESFSKPRGRVVFEGGTLALKESLFGWQGAQVALDGTLQPDPASERRSLVDMNLTVQGLALEPLLQKNFDLARLQGTVSATGAFQGDATSAYELAQSLAGTWQTTGTLRYIPEEEEKIASLVSLLLQNKLKKLPNLKTYSDALNFSLANFAERDASLQASGRLDRLAFTVAQGEVQNPRARLTFTGTAANFTDNSLDLKAEIFEEQKDQPAYRVALTGHLAKPKVRLEDTGAQSTEQEAEYDPGTTLRIPDENIDRVADEVIKGVLDEILDGILNP